MTAAQPTTKMDRNAGSLGSSSGVRTSATECAIVAAARAIPPARTGHSVRRAGALAAASRQTQTGRERRRRGGGEPEVDVLDPRATRGSERTRKTLSVQLSQQFGSKKGSRNSARPSAERAASR